MTERGIRLCTPFSTTVSHHASAAVATRDQAGGADKFLSVLMFGLALLRLHFDGNGFASQIPPPVDNTTPPPASSSMDATEWAIRFLEDRVQRDPLDFIAFNKLATYYLQRLRETGGLQYLDLASNSARASLAAMPAGQNTGGLTALAQVEYALHHFAEAIQLARQASQGDPRNTSASFIAGDAYLELGQDAEAEKLYRALEHSNPSPEVTVRLARLAELRGNHHETIELMRRAVSESQGRKNQDGSAVWYHIRLGEVYFRTGEFQQAEEQFEAALKTWPGHYLALEHLAELRAAQAKYDEAIALYQKVIARVPRAEFYQAMGDIYAFEGKSAEASPWHERALAAYLKSIEQGNAHYFHHLASFYSDTQENPAEALKWARKDLTVRQSVFAYDTLAWALYRNGEFAHAADTIKKALALGTKDAHLLFHAGMIYTRAGDMELGRTLLRQVFQVNPRYNSFHLHRQ